MTRRFALLVMMIGLALVAFGCGQKAATPKSPSGGAGTLTAKVTFLELGSTTCIPCKKMQPIMKSIETRYVGQVKVVFYDVLKDKAPVTQYGIKLIPTQVFLDSSGHELMRHEGFLAEEEIDKFLKTQGVSPTS
jgi:thioredoxin 1